MATWQIWVSIGLGWVGLATLGLWWFSVIARSRKIEPVILDSEPRDYLVIGKTVNGFTYRLGFNLLDPEDYGIHANAVSYIRCWMFLKRAKIEFIVDAKTNQTLYFKDIE